MSIILAPLPLGSFLLPPRLGELFVAQALSAPSHPPRRVPQQGGYSPLLFPGWVLFGWVLGSSP